MSSAAEKLEQLRLKHSQQPSSNIIETVVGAAQAEIDAISEAPPVPVLGADIEDP